MPASAGRDLYESIAEWAFAPLDAQTGDLLKLSRRRDGADLIQTRSIAREDKAVEIVREQLFRLGDDGSVALVEEKNHIEKVEVVFDPPLLVLPARIETGATFESSGRMTVHPLGDRSKVKVKGTYDDSGSCEGAVRVSTSGGEFDVWKIKSVFTADLPPSKVRNETESWLSPTSGPIVERRSERTTVLGVPVRKNEEAWVLIGPGAEKQ
jgi:hypothetical protein